MPKNGEKTKTEKNNKSPDPTTAKHAKMQKNKRGIQGPTGECRTQLENT